MNLNIENSDSIFHKCMSCSKKIMFSGKCKCENYYCDKHRFNHNCSFAYFQENKTRLEKNNPKIDSAKLVKL